MKRFLAFSLAIVMMLSLSACGAQKEFLPKQGVSAPYRYINKMVTDLRLFERIGESGNLCDEITYIPVLFSAEQGKVIFAYMPNGIAEVEVVKEEVAGTFTIDSYMLTHPAGADKDVACIPIQMSKCFPGTTEGTFKFTDKKGNTEEIALTFISAESALYYRDKDTYSKSMVITEEGTYKLKFYTIDGDKGSVLKNATKKNGTWSSTFLGTKISWNRFTNTAKVTLKDLSVASDRDYFIEYSARNGMKYIAYFTIQLDR